MTTTTTITSAENGEMLTNIKSVLECPCCSEIMQSPLMFTTCSHAFCSVCIRRWLLSKRACPVCNAEQEEHGLITCLALGKVIDILNGKNASHTNNSNNIKPKLTRLPNVVYHVLTDDKLDEALKSFGLPVNGSRESKIALHREYTLQWNSRVDSGDSDVDLAQIRKDVLSIRSSKAVATFFRTTNASTNTTTKQNASSSSSSNAIHNNENKKEITKIELALRKERKRARQAERMKWNATRVPVHWRAVFSDYLNKPVYYNSLTKECTTERPVELEIDGEYADDTQRSKVVKQHENPEDEEEDVVVVVERNHSKRI
jgi:hypothetical protein